MKRTVLLVVSSFFIFGCSPIPKVKKNEIIQVEQNKNIQMKNLICYKNENLNRLITLILDSNKELTIARLNIEKSLKGVDLVNSQQGLSIDITGGAQRQKLAKNGLVSPPMNGKIVEVGKLGIQAQYDIDLFNKISSLTKEAKYKSEAISLSSDWLKLNLITQGSKLYFFYNYLLDEKMILSEEKEILTNLYNLEKRRYEIGKSTEETVLQFENSLIKLDTAIKTNSLNLKNIKDSIKYLAGNKYDDEIDNLLAPHIDISEFSMNIPEQINSELIINRPDIKYYMMLIKAQEEHLKSAKAGFYPHFSITGEYGFEAKDFNKILQKSSLVGLVGGSIYLPIFHMNAIRTNYKIAGIDLNIFIEEYNKAVLEGFTNINKELLTTKTMSENLKIFNQNYENDIKIFEKNKEKLNIGSISKYDFYNQKLKYLNSKLLNRQEKFKYLSQILEFNLNIGNTEYVQGGNYGTK